MIPGQSRTPILEVQNLHVDVRTPAGVVAATRGVDLQLRPGETLALVGESGSGKSVTTSAILGTLPCPPFSIPKGRVLLQGQDLLTLPDGQRRQVLGERIATVFQDALSALNPAFTVGWQIGEMLRRRRGVSRGDALRRARELMDRVGIPEAASRIKDYPHEFSGGMQQRVVIAMALALEPEILIADEPTTALDVTVQERILALLSRLQRETGMAMILITHDLGVAAQMADRVAVMYAGRILENAAAEQLFTNPSNPYTRDLLASIPRADVRARTLQTIEGYPPDLTAMPPGCPYHTRCRLALEVCRQKMPPLNDVASGHSSACHVMAPEPVT